MGYTVPLHDTSDFFSYSYYASIVTPLEFDSENNLIGDPFADTFATCILDAKYEQVNIHDVAFDQKHLLLDQQHNLFNILSKHKKLFDGFPWSLSS